RLGGPGRQGDVQRQGLPPRRQQDRLDHGLLGHQQRLLRVPANRHDGGWKESAWPLQSDAEASQGQVTAPQNRVAASPPRPRPLAPVHSHTALLRSPPSNPSTELTSATRRLSYNCSPDRTRTAARPNGVTQRRWGPGLASTGGWRRGPQRPL